MRRNRKGAYAWLVATFFIFMIGFLWVIFNHVMNGFFFPFFDENSADYPADAKATQNQVELSWNWWPLMAIIGVIFWAFVRSTKEEPQTAYYGV